jgi:hypothetical protein
MAEERKGDSAARGKSAAKRGRMSRGSTARACLVSNCRALQAYFSDGFVKTGVIPEAVTAATASAALLALGDDARAA